MHVFSINRNPSDIWPSDNISGILIRSVYPQYLVELIDILKKFLSISLANLLYEGQP
jgi:hypothetical protein